MKFVISGTQLTKLLFEMSVRSGTQGNLVVYRRTKEGSATFEICRSDASEPGAPDLSLHWAVHVDQRSRNFNPRPA